MDNVEIIRKILKLGKYDEVPQYIPLPEVIEVMRFIRSGELEKISGDTRISDTKLSLKCRKLLGGHGLTKVSELFNMRDEDFLKIRGLGQNTLNEINALKKNVQS